MDSKRVSPKLGLQPPEKSLVIAHLEVSKEVCSQFLKGSPCSPTRRAPTKYRWSSQGQSPLVTQGPQSGWQQGVSMFQHEDGDLFRERAGKSSARRHQRAAAANVQRRKIPAPSNTGEGTLEAQARGMHSQPHQVRSSSTASLHIPLY